ncbi:MAG: LacI family transcriptional regulator [Clostridiales bacterium]|nr:LacI family transcriptional regulator [Clostridiales bacterium]
MTIYDIAKEAGVAPSTVSRVINNKPGFKFKEETRQKILALLEKYNYTPDMAARGLVTQSTRMVGVLIVDIRVEHHIGSAFYIEKQMTEKGYCTIIMGTGMEDEKKVEYIRILKERRVEGVVLMGSTFMSDCVKEEIRQSLPDIPVVMVNGWLDLPNVSGIVVDDDTGAGKCVDYMVQKGKKNIVFVRDGYSPSLDLKETGYRAGMRKHGLGNMTCVYQAGDGTPEAGEEITRQILTEHPDTQGIIYAIDILAAGGMRTVQDMGRRVPEDVAVIGIDNSIYGRLCMPKLTTLDTRMKELSNMAAELLLKGLEGNVENVRYSLTSEIVERESA